MVELILSQITLFLFLYTASMFAVLYCVKLYFFNKNKELLKYLEINLDFSNQKILDIQSKIKKNISDGDIILINDNSEELYKISKYIDNNDNLFKNKHE